MMDLNTLVTKDYLKKFGDKAKIMFARNPKHINTSSQIFVIHTSLIYNDASQGFSSLYLNLMGKGTLLIEGSIYDLLLDSQFVFTTDSGYCINLARGINLAELLISAMLITRDAENYKINIYFKTDTSTIKDLVLESVAFLGGTQVQDWVESIEAVTSITIDASNYYLIAINDASLFITPANKIGEILNTSTIDTLFSITNKEGDPVNYQHGVPFESIYQAGEAHLLDGDIKFNYDWQHPPLSDGDQDIPIGNLQAGSTVTIPIPNLLNGADSEDQFVYGVKVHNGLVTDVDTNGIPVATPSLIGGICISLDVTTLEPDKLLVQLDSNNKAFVDASNIIGEPFLVDLNEEKYSLNILLFTNKIFQHIGETSTRFVNGYFYKVDRLAQNYLNIGEATDVYNNGGRLGQKLQQYMLSEGVALNINDEFTLYVDTSDYYNASTIGAINLFSLKQNDSNVITLTRTLLLDVLDLTIKNEYDSVPTSDTNSEIMTYKFKIIGDYAWLRIDVQPRNSGVGIDFEAITSDEINYLFRTHVENITITTSNPLDIALNDLAFINYSINPDPGTITEYMDINITATSSNPEIVSIGRSTPASFKIAVNSHNIEGSATITITSVSDPDISASCVITVEPYNE